MVVPRVACRGEGLPMRNGWQRFLVWAPRLFGILFAAFLAVFALDVFGEGYGFAGTIVALAMHLVPSLIVLGILAIAWHHEWVGAVLFLALAAAYITMAWGRFHWSVYALIPGPLVLLGILLFASGLMRKRRPS